MEEQLTLDPVELAYKDFDRRFKEKVDAYVVPSELQLTEPMSRMFATLKEGMLRRHAIFALGHWNEVLYPGEILLDQSYRSKKLGVSMSNFSQLIRYLYHAGLIKRRRFGTWVVLTLVPFFTNEEAPIRVSELERINQDRLREMRHYYPSKWGTAEWRESRRKFDRKRIDAIRTVLADFNRIYKQTFGRWPKRRYGMDENAAKQLLEAGRWDREEVNNIIKLYLGDQSTWLTAAGHPLHKITMRLSIYKLQLEHARQL